MRSQSVFEEIAAVEAERRRLADLLEGSIIEPLNLLLAQANAYEQTMTANPQARMAVSVLGSLARQLLQQARDLQSGLHPTLLEVLGLEPALESVAGQMTRVHGLRIALDVERLRERLSAGIELALFRAAQDALAWAVHDGHASRVSIRLECRDDWLRFSYSDDSLFPPVAEVTGAIRRRVEQIGGVFSMAATSQGGLEFAAVLRLETAEALTARENEVLRLLAEGLTNKEIAGAMRLSPRTVNFHLDNIYAKLGVNSRTEAVVHALRRGLVRRSPIDPG